MKGFTKKKEQLDLDGLNPTQAARISVQKKRIKIAVAVSLVMFATSVSAIFWEGFAKPQNEGNKMTPTTISDSQLLSAVDDGIDPPHSAEPESAASEQITSVETLELESLPMVLDSQVEEQAETVTSISVMESEIPPQPSVESRYFLFNSGQMHLSLEQKHELEAWVQQQIVDKKLVSASVEGYCDPSGSAKSNQQLSAERAEWVKESLEEYLDLDAGIVSAEGKGETFLFDPKNLAENRRVVVTLKIEPTETVVNEIAMKH